MTKIVKVTEVSSNRPMCQEKLKLIQRYSVTTEGQRRVSYRGVRGVPPDQCAKPSVWIIDGVPMCANHAGQKCIEILVEKDKENNEV